MIKTNGIMKIDDIVLNEPPRLLILFDKGHRHIARVVADVIGQSYFQAGSLEVAKGRLDVVVIGLENDAVTDPESLRKIDRTRIVAHCIDAHDSRDENLAFFCDYEYLYTSTTDLRRDLARFLGLVLGQTSPHEHLERKQRTTVLSTTFPDVRDVLPNLDILSVGADAVELRVDLLRDHVVDGTFQDFDAVPGLKFVGEQVMFLRQHTELPIVFTVRSTRGDGRFHLDDPILFYKYLRKALQWGCEYIDVELWLPEDIRRQLWDMKGFSKIISAWYDLSGKFKWTSSEAHRLFKQGAVYGDIVKMVALANNMEENHELECFRATVQSKSSHPPFLGFNMGTVGQLSRTVNKVFTPVTHSLLPRIVAHGQLSAAEIKSILHSIGQMPALEMYAIGHVHSNGLATFFEKCLNELGQPHRLVSIKQAQHGTIEALINKPMFGGAYLNPPLPVDTAPYLPTLTEAASAIGFVDTIAVRSTNHGRTLLADNVAWQGIRATLMQGFVPSAYRGRAALVLGVSEADAASAIYALRSLNIGCIYTIGFVTHGTTQIHGLDALQRAEDAFVIISTLSPEKSSAASPILKHYSNWQRRSANCSARVFVDLSTKTKRKGDMVSLAAALGWGSYTGVDVNARTIVEALRLLIGENVSSDFVRLAYGQGL